jgi:putative DNA primase/helicase
MVDGCLEWQREGLGEPAEVREATSAYRSEADLVGRFIEERCAVEPTEQATAKELYAAYQAWHGEVGENDRPMSKKAFGQRLAERGFDSAQIGKGRARFWIGVGLAGGATGDEG